MKTKLGSLGDIFIGLTYKPEDVSEQGVIVLRSGNVQDGNLVFDDIVRVSKNVSDRFFVKENDILMCSRNGSARLVGKSALIPHLNEQTSFGAFMTIIRTPYNSYLKHFFDSEAFRRQLGSSATSTINQITKNMLDNIEVDLPEKNDMDSIVCILDKINQIISKQKTQLSKFDELIKSRFVELFGDPTIIDKDKAYMPMTSICEIIDGDRGRNYPKQEEFYEDGYCLFLNAKNVTSNGFDFTNCMFITKEKDELLRKGKLNRGDVVLTTRGTIGNLAYYSDDVPFDNVRINSGMVILRMNHELVDEIFFIEQFKLQLAEIKEVVQHNHSCRFQL